MAHAMTERARAAFEWAAKYALPGSCWYWDAKTTREDVRFKVEGYAVLADPHVGCVLEIGSFRLRPGRGNLRKVQIGELPEWYHRCMPAPTLLPALDLKGLVDAGRIRPINIR